jgi:hypothetical protein
MIQELLTLLQLQLLTPNHDVPSTDSIVEENLSNSRLSEAEDMISKAHIPSGKKEGESLNDHPSEYDEDKALPTSLFSSVSPDSVKTVQGDGSEKEETQSVPGTPGIDFPEWSKASDDNRASLRL